MLPVLPTLVALFALRVASAPALPSPSPRPSPIAGDDAGMSCTGNLVQLGESQASVLMKCNAPWMKTSRTEKRKWNGTVVYITVDVWTYSQGKGSFLRVLTFRDGTLTDISLGAYVS